MRANFHEFTCDECKEVTRVNDKDAGFPKDWIEIQVNSERASPTFHFCSWKCAGKKITRMGNK